MRMEIRDYTPELTELKNTIIRTISDLRMRRMISQ